MSDKVVRHQASERHECTGRREGNWIIYSCPQCDFQLKNNLVTGETHTVNAREDVAHGGWYVPVH